MRYMKILWGFKLQNGSPNLGQKTRSGLIKNEFADFWILLMRRRTIEWKWKKAKRLANTWTLLDQKALEQRGQGHTSCSWGVRNGPQDPGDGSGGIENLLGR